MYTIHCYCHRVWPVASCDREKAMSFQIPSLRVWWKVINHNIEHIEFFIILKGYPRDGIRYIQHTHIVIYTITLSSQPKGTQNQTWSRLPPNNNGQRLIIIIRSTNSTTKSIRLLLLMIVMYGMRIMITIVDNRLIHFYLHISFSITISTNVVIERLLTVLLVSLWNFF